MQQAPTPPPIPDWVFGRTDPMEIAIAVAVVVGTIGSIGVLWMFVRALIRRWTTPPPADTQAIQELKHAVHQLGAEVTELQERLDFAERVLASRKEADRLERGSA
jgi:hypothetical protein